MAKRRRSKERDCTYVIINEEEYHRYRTYDPNYSNWYVVRVRDEDAMELAEAARNGQIHNHFELSARKKSYSLRLYDAIRSEPDEDKDDDC